MTIETKFNIGDKAYVLYEGFIRVAQITKIIVHNEISHCQINYRIQVKDQEPCIYNENEIHATKEDICKFLSRYVH